MKKNPEVEIETDVGRFKIELFPEDAPETVENFLNYVNSGFYNGLIFHLIIPNYIVQGGGFDKNLNYVIPIFQPIKNEADNRLKNKKGTVAMARTTEINSATSQFFINLKDNPNLDFEERTPESFGYTVFGKVKEGFDVVEKIGKIPVKTMKGYESIPIKPVQMINVKVVNQ